MKVIKIILITLLALILAVPLLGCGTDSEEVGPPQSTATVQRGDLTIDITAAGNLALSRTEDLAIDLFYQEGTVEEVLVEEGDTVEEGQVVAKLDIDEWEDELSSLEDRIITADRALVQAQINLLTSNQSLKTAQDNKATRELAVLNAQISLATAETNLNDAIKNYGWAEFEPIEAELNRAKAWYERVDDSVSQTSTDIDDSLLILERAKERLDAAQADYDNFVSGHGNERIDLKKKQVTAAQMSLEQAQIDLDDVADDVALKELQLTLNEGKVTDARKALADARDALEEAQSKSPEVKAPFAGFITSVNVEGGDEVLKGTVAVQLADPNRFEANILVSEMDILQVKLGGEAWVDVDAMSGLSLPAKVTHISPTATIQSGVVNYEVKVELESLEAVVREGRETMKQAMADIAAGQFPPPLQQAIDEGRITREQAEEMIKQGPPPGMAPPEGMELPSAAGSPVQGQLPSAVPEDFQLREGLTVTVSIIVEERTDVLLVPNAAVTTQGTQSYVQVMTASGETEQRAINTGISDFQFTEVTGGLDEGEEIIVPQGTVTVTPEDDGPPRMGLFGPPPRR